ncbi:unnamed protein product, partial [Cladocopium goreaui]
MDIIAHNAAISNSAKQLRWQLALQHWDEISRRRLEGNDITRTSLFNALRGRWAPALSLLSNKGPANIITVGAALHAIRRWPWTMQLLQRLPEQSLQLNAVVSSSSMGALGDALQWLYALQLLVELESRSQANLVSYNAASHAILAMAWTSALEVLEAATGAALQLSAVSYGTLLRAEGWPQAIQTLQQMEERMPWSLASLGSAVAASTWPLSVALVSQWKEQGQQPNLQIQSACITGSPWHISEHLFWALRSPDVVAYGAAMTSSNWPASLVLLCNAQEARFVPSVPLCVASISACERSAAWQPAMSLLQRAVLEVAAHNTVISACAKASQWQNALQILSTIHEAKLEINSVSMNASISACEMLVMKFRGKAAQWQHALQLYLSLPAMFLEADCVACNALISAFEKSALWAMALHFLHDFLQQRQQMDVVAFNAAISAAEKSGHWQSAICILSDMHGYTVQADRISFNALISACEKSAMWAIALQLLEDFQLMGGRCDEFTCSAAISACEKGFQWPLALDLLWQMEKLALQMDAIAYNAAISACEKGFQWRKALHLLSLMKQRGSIITYAALITACGKCEEWRQVQALLDELQSCQMEANSITCNAVISAYRKAEEWQLALAFFQNLQETFAPVDVLTYAAAADACALGRRMAPLTELLEVLPRRALSNLQNLRK